MSGRKDFSISYSVGRAAREFQAAALRAQQRAAMIEEVQANLSAVRLRTGTEISEQADARTKAYLDGQAANRKAVADRLAELAKRNLADLNAINQGTSESSGVETVEFQSAETSSALSPPKGIPFGEVQDEIVAMTAQLKVWQSLLSRSTEVQNFGSERLAAWLNSTSSLLNVEKVSDNTKQRLESVQLSILEAERIEAQAIETSERYERRNSLIKDILDSLQEVGFFVEDPKWVDPARPELPVLIRATRADQTMIARVHLNCAVESDWLGVHGEHCTDAFFHYVQQMNLRGVQVTPRDPLLVPKLTSANSLDLPASRGELFGK